MVMFFTIPVWDFSTQVANANCLFPVLDCCNMLYTNNGFKIHYWSSFLGIYYKSE